MRDVVVVVVVVVLVVVMYFQSHASGCIAAASRISAAAGCAPQASDCTWQLHATLTHCKNTQRLHTTITLNIFSQPQ